MGIATKETSNLQESITHHIARYLETTKGQDVRDMYDMVIEQMEQPLLQAVIEHCKYNQSRACKALGISRGTLRKKLKKHFDDKYCGTRGS